MVELATNFLNIAKNYRKKKAAVKASLESAISLHNDLLLTVDKNIVFCYTDGSALPNPGLSGAAASIFLCGLDLLIDVGLPLGLGTNNFAELAALSICLNELMAQRKVYPFSKVIFFCDSKYALILQSVL